MGPKEGNLLHGKIIDIGYIFFSLERYVVGILQFNKCEISVGASLWSRDRR